MDIMDCAKPTTAPAHTLARPIGPIGPIGPIRPILFRLTDDTDCTDDTDNRPSPFWTPRHLILDITMQIWFYRFLNYSNS